MSPVVGMTRRETEKKQTNKFKVITVQVAYNYSAIFAQSYCFLLVQKQMHL